MMIPPPAAAWKLILASVAAALSVIALGCTLVWRINTTEQFRQQTVTNCRQVENLKEAFADVLIDAKTGSLSRATDPAVRKALVAFYDRQIARFAPKECP